MSSDLLIVLSKILQIVIRYGRWVLDSGLLIMNSIFLGMINSHDLPVNQSIVIAEAFAVVGIIWDPISLLFSVCSGVWYISIMVIPAEVFVMGCHIFIAMVYKNALADCKGYADTPFGNITAVDGLPSVRDACGMQVANFALSTIVA